MYIVLDINEKGKVERLVLMCGTEPYLANTFFVFLRLSSPEQYSTYTCADVL